MLSTPSSFLLMMLAMEGPMAGTAKVKLGSKSEATEKQTENLMLNSEI